MVPCTAAWLAACLATGAALGAAAVAAAHGGAAPLTPLPPFSAIYACVPFSLRIRPGPAYALTVDSEDPATAASLAHAVDGGTLSLWRLAPLVTNSCASVVVELLAGALRERTPQNETAWPEILIEGGFRVARLEVGMQFDGQGDPQLVIQNATADTLVMARHRAAPPCPPPPARLPRCTCRRAGAAAGAFRVASVRSEDANCPDDDLRTSNSMPCLEPAVAVVGVTERVVVNGSTEIVTSNASLSIEGPAGQVVRANAGTCNLRVPAGAVSVLTCDLTGAAAADAGPTVSRAPLWQPSCEFRLLEGLGPSNDTYSCPANASEFDETSGLGLARSALAAPPAGVLADQALADALAAARAYAARAAAGDAAAAANVTEPAGRAADVDLLALLTVVALREGGPLGALAAANETEWGSGTRFGPRDSYQRAIAVLANQNDTSALRRAFDAMVEYEALVNRTGASQMHDNWFVGAVEGNCTGGQQWCVKNYGGVRTPNATALLLAAALGLENGTFAANVTAALANRTCVADPKYPLGLAYCEAVWEPPPLSCPQLRDALCDALALVPRYRWGSAVAAAAAAHAAPDPDWQACIARPSEPPCLAAAAGGAGAGDGAAAGTAADP
eukprot:scaffold2.g7010.t1